MLSTYSSLFRAPGAGAFSGAGFLARLPMSMVSIGTILMVSISTGAYAIAGVLSGAITFAGSISMPQLARLVDRLGQARVLRPTLLVQGVAMSLMIVAVRADWPVWSWFATGMVAGASQVSIGSMVRARWTRAISGTARRQTAFAFESVVDEVIFVIGPPLATILATSVSPEAGLITAIVFAIAGGFLFSSLKATEPPVHPSGTAVPRREVMTRGLIAVCITFLGAGTVFGSVEVAVVAFADERGQRGLAGAVLACYAAGSLLSGLVYGSRQWHRPLAQRFVIASGCFGVATLLPLLAGSVAVLAPLIFLTGLAIAPVLISGMTLVERLVPRSALTEGLTWGTTALTIGVTIGAAFAGPLVDAYGGAVTFRLPAAAAVLTAIAAVAGRTWLSARAPTLRPTPGAEVTVETVLGRGSECPVPGATSRDGVPTGSQGKMKP